MSDPPIVSPNDSEDTQNMESQYRKRIDSIMCGRQDLLENHTHLEEQAANVKAERINIIRRVRELASKQPLRSAHRQTLERELYTLKKESMVVQRRFGWNSCFLFYI